MVPIQSRILGPLGLRLATKGLSPMKRLIPGLLVACVALVGCSMAQTSAKRPGYVTMASGHAPVYHSPMPIASHDIVLYTPPPGYKTCTADDANNNRNGCSWSTQESSYNTPSPAPPNGWGCWLVNHRLHIAVPIECGENGNQILREILKSEGQ